MPSPSAHLPPPYIGDYGIIGNLHTTALVSKHGGLDFLPYPRFDRATVFARLLDEERGGTWAIALAQPDAATQRTTQRYLPDTAVLATRFHHAGGIAEVIDFMPPVDDEAHCQVVRVVRGIAGASRLRLRFAPRYPYGAEAARARASEVPPASHASDERGEPVRTHATFDVPLGPASATLSADVPLAREGDELVAEFVLGAGERRTCIFQSDACEAVEGSIADYGERLLAFAKTYWREWADGVRYAGEHRQMVTRSVITLKLCTSAKHGSSVAAPTFGLPEVIGGKRNYDYRFTWIRDSAFTMYAFLRLGLSEEAEQFIGWIEARCSELDTAADLSLMYRVDGSRDVDEVELDHLGGYRESTPVRVGNGAQGQRQLDIYGELIDTVYLYDRFGHEITYEFWRHLLQIIDYVVDTWREPDHGIWENRGEPRQFTASKVFAWVAIDRGLRIAEHRGFPAPRERWRDARDAIYEEMYDSYFDRSVSAWTQTRGNDAADGSLLMLPLIRFVMTDEPAWRSTLEHIESRLADGCLIRRYESDNAAGDGFDGEEGYFTMCSFWYVECLAKNGRVDEARDHLTTLVSYANHLGLYSEQIATDGQLLGNFPQAFTHLGFISAALQIAEQRGRHPGPEDAPRELM